MAGRRVWRMNKASNGAMTSGFNPASMRMNGVRRILGMRLAGKTFPLQALRKGKQELWQEGRQGLELRGGAARRKGQDFLSPAPHCI